MGWILVVIAYTTALCYETLPTSQKETGAPVSDVRLKTSDCSEREEELNDRIP